jgi:CheY-like chemotaxis protein
MSEMSNWTVLLVDDEPDSLDLISVMIEHEGAVVHCAASGDECLILLKELVPTLVVVDLAMPHPDGWDLLEYIRANPATANVPVVATTAFHTANVAQQAVDAGFDAYIPKPLKSQQLLDTLYRAVQG